MAQDLRTLMKEDNKLNTQRMPNGHKKRFMQLLDEEMPVKPKQHGNYLFFKIAASLLILISLGVVFYNEYRLPVKSNTVVEAPSGTNVQEQKQITLGDLSPDLQKVENYYMASINVELAELEITDENKQLFDGYMNRLEELNTEYKKLTEELNEVGPNDKTVSALIDNLQIRLQLLYRLKDKLKELKEENDETFNNEQV